MNELKFNSQVCTDINQSKKLLKLGLKPETADMYHTTYYDANDNNNSARYTCVRHRRLPLLSQEIPAWSLHRLMEILDAPLVEFAFLSYDPYEEIIYNVSECIKNGYINKEYLKQ